MFQTVDKHKAWFLNFNQRNHCVRKTNFSLPLFQTLTKMLQAVHTALDTLSHTRIELKKNIRKNRKREVFNNCAALKRHQKNLDYFAVNIPKPH